MLSVSVPYSPYGQECPVCNSPVKHLPGIGVRLGRPYPHHCRDRSKQTLYYGWWNRSRGCEDRKSTRLNSSHVSISYAVFCLKKKCKTFLTYVNHIKLLKKHD